MSLTCFKSYDVRGRLGEELNPTIARRIGRAFAVAMEPGQVVVGRDARETSPGLCAALAEGLQSEGVDVLDLGLCGTEEVYFATGFTGAGGGIMVTASHNPIDYNGMKLVGPGSTPLDPKGDFARIRDAADSASGEPGPARGSLSTIDLREEYATRVCGFVDAPSLQPLNILMNAGNGPAGAAADMIVGRLNDAGAKISVQRKFWTPDGTFPNGIPNPLLPENRPATAEAVVETGADLGVAWDGDFDRCFFFDETGAFVDGEYVVALLAEATLIAEPGADIVHDPRVVWATEDTVRNAGGKTTLACVGHAFMKAEMRRLNAAYGGEMSAHHYFRDFYFCDTGMIPWVQVIGLMSRSGKKLSELVADLKARFPSSGEINFRVPDPKAEITRIVDVLGPGASAIDRMDGASLTFDGWRMNLRGSNTEPLLRLNVETRGDRALLGQKVNEIKALIENQDKG